MESLEVYLYLEDNSLKYDSMYINDEDHYLKQLFVLNSGLLFFMEKWLKQKEQKFEKLGKFNQ